jgi:hypothetical protein
MSAETNQAEWDPPVIPATQKVRAGRLWFDAALGKNVSPIQKITKAERGWGLKQKGTGGMAQLVECLPRKDKALISSPSMFKKKKIHHCHSFTEMQGTNTALF